jgi:hypothetical protein
MDGQFWIDDAPCPIWKAAFAAARSESNECECLESDAAEQRFWLPWSMNRNRDIAVKFGIQRNHRQAP